MDWKTVSRVDLHLHTDKSDGLLKPAEMVRLAKQRGLKAISITDHDTVDGLQEAISAGIEEHVEVVAGVELSTCSNGEDIHILGFFIDHRNDDLRAALYYLRSQRVERALKMLAKLKGMGIDLELDSIAELSKKRSIGRPHIAESLVARGYVSTYREAFDKYLGNNCPAYVEIGGLSPAEGIELIHSARGLAFLAHPIIYMSDDLIVDLVSCGLDGIEVVNPKHSQADVDRYVGEAKKYSLLISGGSDCHGDERGLKAMGRCALSYENLELMRGALGLRSIKNIPLFDIIDFFPDDSIRAQLEADEVKYLTIETDAAFFFEIDIYCNVL